MYQRKKVVAVVVIVFALGGCGRQADTTRGDVMDSAPAVSSAMASTASAAPAAMAGGMDHGAMGSAAPDTPYDARFIDSMIHHHKGALSMAEQALNESERLEIHTLAQAIIDTQRQEIGQMEQWRTAWYGALAPTVGLDMHMGAMAVSGDTAVPYDQRFLTAMISHHEGAVDMARDAQQHAQHADIKKLAERILSAQEREITQMQQWLQDWFGQ